MHILVDTVKMVAQLEEFLSAMDEDDVRQFSSDYFIPLDMHPEAPDVDACIADFPKGKIGLYTRFFEYANYRVPISIRIFEQRAQFLSPSYLLAALYRCGEDIKL